MRNNRNRLNATPRLAANTTAWPRWMLAVVALAILLVQVSAWGGIDQAKPGQSGPAAMPGAAADPHAGMFGGIGSAAMPGGGGMTPSGARMSDALQQQKMLQEFYAKQNRSAFETGLQLDAFRLLAINHMDQMKILDSWARQSISKIRNRQTLDGKDPLYVALDMALRPEVYVDRNIIYVQAVPVREQLTLFAAGSNEAEKRTEQDRIMHEGLVSPNFLLQPQVQQMLEMMSRDTTKMQAANKVFDSLVTFMKLGTSLTFLPPPATTGGAPYDAHAAWINPVSVNLPEEPATAPAPVNAPMAAAQAAATQPKAAPSPYDDQTTRKLVLAFKQLAVGWQENDVALANSGIGGFVAVAPSTLR